MLNNILNTQQGFHPAASAHQKMRYLLNRQDVIIALNRRSGIGCKARSSLSTDQCFGFHIREKEFSRTGKMFARTRSEESNSASGSRHSEKEGP